MKRTEVPMEKLKFVDQDLEAWGDRARYKVDASDMPADGEAYVMKHDNYSKNPYTIQRQPDGSGKIELFWSRGD